MENVIDCLEERGFLDTISSDELRNIVKKPIKLYLGFDPTAESLHLGNLVGIIALCWMQKFGHTPMALVGGATGRIGDPSGKSIERPLLNDEELEKNIAGIQRQLERFLDFRHQKAMLLNNNDWLSNFPLIDFLRDVGKHFRMGPMLSKEAVKTRIDSDEGMSFTEFSYQALQGYDFYYLNKEKDVVLEMGGSDQWGNITAGIELTRKLLGKTVFGATFPLLTRSDGKKFGKSEKGAIWLDANRTSPYELYQYLFRLPDDDMSKMFRILTFLPMEEIRAILDEMKKPEYPPNKAQKRLAEEVTRFVHGEEGLQTALKVTQAAAPGSDAKLDPETLQAVAQDMPRVLLAKSEVIGQKMVDVMVKTGMLTSKGEAVRLIKNGGGYLNNSKVTDEKMLLEEKDLIGNKYLLVGAGKKKKSLVEIE